MIDKLIEQQETIKGMQENEESAIKIMKMYEDYKLRVDKAIEYIKENYDFYYGDELYNDYQEIINILKGDEKQMINEELQCKIKKAEDEYENLKDTIHDLYDENKELKERIDKAIEFIEEHNIIGTNKEYLPSGIEKCYSLELMEILKGDEK